VDSGAVAGFGSYEYEVVYQARATVDILKKTTCTFTQKSERKDPDKSSVSYNHAPSLRNLATVFCAVYGYQFNLKYSPNS
jgi:hypothetical protein